MTPDTVLEIILAITGSVIGVCIFLFIWETIEINLRKVKITPQEMNLSCSECNSKNVEVWHQEDSIWLNCYDCDECGVVQNES